MSWPLRMLAVAVVLTAAAVAAGVLLRTPERPAPPATPALADSLASADTTMMAVQRAPFCDRVPAADLAAALGAPVSRASSYSSGDTATVGRLTDVVDEYGCRWRTAGGADARAWVFGAAVTRAWARDLAGTVPVGCRRTAGAPFGKPTATFECGARTRLVGLFGDAWLTCELRTHDVGLAGRFCLAVARAAG